MAAMASNPLEKVQHQQEEGHAHDLSDLIEIITPELNGAESMPTEVMSAAQQQKPYIQILEEPSESTRYRYVCEGRSAGSILGVSATSKKGPFPAIEVVGCRGVVSILVSCVMIDPPFRPHPHKLVGNGCKKGCCFMKLHRAPYRAEFKNLGVHCTKQSDIQEALQERQEMAVDPFKTGFSHMDRPKNINLNVVRLCFQAFEVITDNGSERHIPICKPVVSNMVYDSKSLSTLKIHKICKCAASYSGGDEIMLLCDKVDKDDVRIRFFAEDVSGKEVWKDYAKFEQKDVFKTVAIAFKVPPYPYDTVPKNAKVYIVLERPSDGKRSKEKIQFEYRQDQDYLKQKRKKQGGRAIAQIEEHLQSKGQLPNLEAITSLCSPSAMNISFTTNVVPSLNNASTIEMRTDPVDMPTPQYFNQYRTPCQMSPSPFSPAQALSPYSYATLTPSPSHQMETLPPTNQTQLCNMLSDSSLNNHNNMSPTTNGICTNGNEDMNFDYPSTSSYALTNPFYNHNHIAPSTSGGSITPLFDAAIMDWHMDCPQSALNQTTENYEHDQIERIKRHLQSNEKSEGSG